MWKRFKEWLSGIGRPGHYVQCDICGTWGAPNLNYKGCGGRAFVHVSDSGRAAYVHSQHVVKHIIAEYLEPTALEG